MFVIVNDSKVFALRQMYLMFILKNKGMLPASWKKFFFSCFKLICWTGNEKYFSLRVLFYMWNFVLVDIVASSLVGVFLFVNDTKFMLDSTWLIHFIGSLRNQISRNRRFPACWAEPNYTWSARQNHPGKRLCGGLISWPHLVIIGPVQS